MQQTQPKRNRLTPWYMGIFVVFLAVMYIGYKMVTGNCPEHTVLDIGLLTVIPIVYLTLMYLTFISQE